MSLFADHLIRSRHGIWYYRWVVPSTVRDHFPNLPRELKRSTRSADIRIARVIAQSMHLAMLRGVSVAMNVPFDPSLIRLFELEFDSDTGRLKRFQAEPSELGEALQAAEELLRMMNERIDQKTSTLGTAVAGSQQVAVDTTTDAPSRVLMSEAFERYAADRLASKNWTRLTYQRAHKPSIDLFRELLGQPVANSAGAAPIDLALGELTQGRLENALGDLRRFPDRQRRRDAGCNAQKILSQGLPPQSLANFNKRLSHIRQFIDYCVNKGWVAEGILRRIAEILALDTRHARKRDALQRGDIRAVVDDGYVAFSHSELAALFGEVFKQHIKGSAHTGTRPPASRRIRMPNPMPGLDHRADARSRRRRPDDRITCSDIYLMSFNRDGAFVQKDGSPYR